MLVSCTHTFVPDLDPKPHMCTLDIFDRWDGECDFESGTSLENIYPCLLHTGTYYDFTINSENTPKASKKIRQLDREKFRSSVRLSLVVKPWTCVDKVTQSGVTNC